MKDNSEEKEEENEKKDGNKWKKKWKKSANWGRPSLVDLVVLLICEQWNLSQMVYLFCQ